MAKHELTEIGKIILNPRNADNLRWGKEVNELMMRHMYGHGMKAHLKAIQPFESDDINSARSQYAISCRDLFVRLLREERQVFTTKGGDLKISENKNVEKKVMDMVVNAVDGKSLRKWVATDGKGAMDTDPMGIVLMEHDGEKTWPTYKCIQTIHDYDTITGRKLSYVCMVLCDAELKAYGVKSDEQASMANPAGNARTYYRFIDAEQDIIVYLDQQTAKEAPMTEGAQAALVNPWGYVPGFIVSDIGQYFHPGRFESRCQPLAELAECFLRERSIRDLQKLYHGFAKAVEPYLQCKTCEGEGLIRGIACPDCTIPGHQKGTGYKTKTRVSDVARFDVEILQENSSFDFRKLFGYVTPDVESWRQQNDDLKSLEYLMYVTKWGTEPDVQGAGFNGKNDPQETATKVIKKYQNKSAELNDLADSAQRMELDILKMMTEYVSKAPATDCSVTYGRDYILTTPEEMLDVYHIMRKAGDAESMLNEIIMKYIRALYSGNESRIAVEIKKFFTRPFPHNTQSEVENSAYVTEQDKVACRYYVEWSKTIKDNMWVSMDIPELQKSLYEYASKKVIVSPINEPE